MSEQADLKTTLGNLREELTRAREEITRLEDLTGGPVEREPGIWEFGFDELEEEMWRRFSILEGTADCTTDEEYFEERRWVGSLLRKWKNLWRGVSSPFSRTVLDKRKQFNLDKQNRINRESIPFHLAAVLTLQKIKDRMNSLEESVRRLQREMEDAFMESGPVSPPGDSVPEHTEGKDRNV